MHLFILLSGNCTLPVPIGISGERVCWRQPSAQSESHTVPGVSRLCYNGLWGQTQPGASLGRVKITLTHWSSAVQWSTHSSFF